jgi:hypothetical protein
LASKTDDAFTDLLTKLVRVPKEKIDEEERKYQETKGEPAKPREIVDLPEAGDRPGPH